MRNTARLFLTILLVALPACAAPLSLDGLIKQAHALVYELPAGEGRSDAMRLVALVQKNLLPGAELIEAGSPDDGSFCRKLTGPFAFITFTPESSRLLPLIAKPLPLKIENGHLQWRGYNAPLAESRIAFVGRNPCGSGNAVAVAIGSLSLPQDMSGEDGLSYLIYRGKDIARRGCYAADFAQAACESLREVVTVAEARTDAQEFFSTIERVHPNPLAAMSAAEYATLKEHSLSEIAARADARGNVRSADVGYVLAYAAARFQDGHTRVFGDPLSLHDRQQPPFWLTANNGFFTIAAAADPSIQGMELLSVNGAPVPEFLRPALDRCPAETLIAREAQVSFCYLSVDLIGTTPVTYHLKLRDRQGGEVERSLTTVGPKEYLKLMPASIIHGPGSGTRVEFLDSGRVARLVYPSFRYSDEEKKGLDDIFRQLRDRRTEALLIDLRGNPGGNSAMGEFLFSYLYAGPFRAFSKVSLRDGANGPWRDHDIAEKRVAKPEAFFSGRVYLLIDNQCFSSASDFAAMFRDYKVGTILGYETGGVPLSFGDTFEFRLPYSGILCHASFKRFWPPKPRPGDDAHGVLPDVAITAERVQPYRQEADPDLAFALDHVRQSRQR